MSIIRDEYGAVELNSINYKLLSNLDNKHFIISYNENIYYLKYCFKLKNIYNGLLAYEIAKDYGIKVAEIDLFTYNGFYGTMCKDVTSNGGTLIPMDKLIGNSNNNLEDIWYMLYTKYNNNFLVTQLMDELVNLFLFDVLIGNSDRHTGNYGLIETNKAITLCDLFDNEEMLSSDSINEGFYSLGVNSDDYNAEYVNLLYKFLIYSDTMYLEKLKSKLWIIENDNVNKIIKRVEDKIGCPIQINIKNDITKKIYTNLCMINSVIKKVERGVKVYAYTV